MTTAQRIVRMWVIFVGFQPLRGSGARYIAGDGSITTDRRQAEKFSTAWGARDFAREQGIILDHAASLLDDTAPHIGQAAFTQAEIEWRPLG
jgi:hypothetical protein